MICGCEMGGNCTKTTVCQHNAISEQLAEALENLLDAVLPDLADSPDYWNNQDEIIDARKALEDFNG